MSCLRGYKDRQTVKYTHILIFSMDDDDDDGGGGGGGNSRGSLPHWHTNPQPLVAIGFQTQIYIYLYFTDLFI